MRQSSEPNFMYIGPTISVLGLKKNTLYRGQNGMPPQLVSLVKTQPMLTSLYVPTKKLLAARKAITMRGSIEFQSVQTLIRMIKAQ